MGLNVEQLNQHYGSSHTLRDVSFNIADKGCTAVLGRNGAGKTTLLKCLMGVLPTSSGKISWNGQTLTDMAPYRRVRAGFGYVPQGREIFADLSVGQNLELAAAATRIDDPEEAVAEAVSLFPVIGEMWRRRGGDLSGGQQQQLSIARALVTRPDLLILDEPTEGVQPSIVSRIEEVIAELGGRLSILLVEQYFEFARSIADRYVVLSRGEVALSGDVSEMDDHAVRQFLAV
ncbi:urea ABC transporter ATP-binding subunit UrtE [Roseibium algicola]|uniref:Urea ABC transporter ATP-binding subunit UrtE n=1 Tax=Roseibium algicola TaxID=2857014 RepID=A0ABN4WXB6_9HYPH|nr:urea ABC transporter ATP-binding subunit UrtE [Roseibium aggregatum]AQQ03878.1 urea ABC transporter ATP-binding subunit UrtE [Roseibium aggregatum]